MTVAAKKKWRSRQSFKPDLRFEKALWKKGLCLVAGTDEAGRGALAGPVYAGVVMLPPDGSIRKILDGVNDSKKLTAGQREHWARIIKEVAAGYGTGSANVQEIDRLGILPATRLAVQRALLELKRLPDHLLVDFIQLPDIPIPQTSLVKGDARSLSIASASILAKTSRDQVMLELNERHPGYGWHHNMGYGTQTHLNALTRLGPSAAHRRSFAPLRHRLAKDTN